MDMTTPNATDDQGGGAVTEPVTEPSTVEESTTNYADTFLKDVPELERPIVEKYVRQWDAGVTQRFQDVHSEYEPYKPFKEAGVDPEDLNGALALAQALENDPQGTLQLIAQHYGVSIGEAAKAAAQTLEQGNQPPPVTAPPVTDFTANPEFQRVQQMAEAAAQILLNDQQMKQQAEEDKALDAELTKLHTEHGDFDEAWVIPRAISSNIPLADAVKEYKDFVNNILTANNRPAAPTILGSGGGLPSTQLDLGKMSSKETKNLVAEMLTKAHQEQ